MSSELPRHSRALEKDPGTKALSRRRALAKLGLAAGAVYAAPTITNLDRRALAAGTPCPPRWQKGPRPPHCH